MDKAYDPKKWEKKISKLWRDNKSFEPNNESTKDPFCIIMPPPNANGSLHMGHLMFVVEDIAARYARMQDRPTLWLPGTDHAGIETQYVFEKELEKSGKSRFDLGPQKFYEQVMNFTLSHQGIIISQMQSMGFSADWSKLKFTLDEDIIDIVYDTFSKLHDDGCIYRGNRLVNWCTNCQAAFADIETTHIKSKDKLYYLDYGTLQIATTRPETIFADVAVAVNPNDKRYKSLVGKTATIPLTGREIPIIADEHVSIKDGSGALKITPAHDQADYEIGLKNNLPEISVIDKDGKLVNVPEEFAGLGVKEARVKVVQSLKNNGKLAKATPLTHAIAVHDRCKNQIEPLISEQWFLRVKELNQATIQAIEDEKVKFYPKRFKKIALNWLAQEHDWCISRQIWWGIRIPIYYKTSNDPDKKPYIIAKNEDQAKKYYGEDNYRSEEDTFDTWFSSGQWPYATLMSINEFDKFYPTSMMGTARDILHKWVTRMIMLSLYRTGEVPFENVYLWGMVTDEKGQKLSKSKGNYDDPMEITKKFGTDALRLALSIGVTPGNDGKISEQKVQGYRNFCNKLWNVSRFVLDKTGKNYSPTPPLVKFSADHWILDKLSKKTKKITGYIESYKYSQAGSSIYSLLWDDFADWYVENSKNQLNIPVLVYTLENILKLVHPFAPFVSEAIWQLFPWTKNQIINEQIANDTIKFNKIKAKKFSDIKSVVSYIRQIKADIKLDSSTKIYFTDEKTDTIEQIARLSGIKKIEKTNRGHKISSKFSIRLDIPDELLKDYLKNLRSQIEQKQQYIDRLQEKLKNQGFIRNAPKKLISDQKNRLETALEELKKLKITIGKFGEN